MIILVSFSISAAEQSDTGTRSKADLEWGTVLFSYYQQDYLSALIDYQYVKELENSHAKTNSGKLLNGGMMLSYGMPDPAQKVFQALLNENSEPMVRNTAWYHLANLYYHKSQPDKANQALSNIKGEIASDLHTQYHYLATLVSEEGQHLKASEKLLNSLPKTKPHYSYILFNHAISLLQEDKISQAIKKLESVASMADDNSETLLLADRARHGLAQISLQQGNTEAAWSYLKAIRTTGLYSNRALLTYAWTAIKLARFNQAIPALQILDQRSIAIPEVQETKVLLAHLFEQEGSPRKALKQNLLAIEAFNYGLKEIKKARETIALKDVPKELIINFDSIIGLTDWYAVQPTVDYQGLSSFFIDLVSSNIFTETVKELTDLYAIQENLSDWKVQANEHLLILSNVKKATLSDEKKKLIAKSDTIKLELQNRQDELKLYSLVLPEDEQERLTSLLESTKSQVALMQSRIEQIKQVEKPYQQPKGYDKKIKRFHLQIEQKLVKTEGYIKMLEPVFRRLINTELDKHEERMRYYLAQSRLAKARLYDTTLMNIKKSNKSPLSPDEDMK